MQQLAAVLAVARAGGLAATMITLAVLFVVDQVVKNWTELTRGAGGLSGIPRITTNTWLWVAAFAALVVVNVFRESRVGRFAVATRDDEIAAQLAGINLGRARVLAFVVSAACAGVAGALLAVVTRLAAPTSFNVQLSIFLLVAIVIGGLGSLVGALIGSALLVFLVPFVTDLGRSAGLNAAQAANTAPLVFGIILVVIGVPTAAGGGGVVEVSVTRPTVTEASDVTAGAPSARGGCPGTGRAAPAR